MLFVNDTDQTVIVAIGKGGMKVPPKGTVEIEDGYALPRRMANGARRKSVIEQVAPQLKPADPMERAQWELAPEPTPANLPRLVHMPTVAGLMANGVAEGPARLIVQQAHEAALASLEAKAEKSKKGKE